ncbi:MAG: TonB-dependent siderophore receptor [Pseudomonadota bacterium]
MALFALVAAAGPASSVQAAERAPSWQLQEEIIVVGDRAESYAVKEANIIRGGIAIRDWPQSVQVLNRTLLDEQNLRSTTEALRNVSGVIPNHEQETVLVNPFVRGQEAEIYLDGLVGYGDTAVLDPSTLIAFERVEVAKGPTSTQYGGGVGAPTGGLINLVTKTPRDEASYDLALRGGSFNTRSFEGDINQPLSEAVGFRLAGEWFQSDDMIDAVEVERLTLNPSLSAKLGEDTELIIRGLYNEIEQLEYTGIPAEVARLPEVDDRQFSGAVNAPNTEVENLSLHATLEHAFNDDFGAMLQLRYFSSEFEEYSSFPFLNFFPIDGTSAPIIRGQLPVETEEVTVDAALSYQLRHSGSVEHNLRLGITWDLTDYTAGSGFDFTPIGVLDYASGVNDLDFGPIPAINSTIENEYQTLAVYLQDHVAIGDRWHLLLSGRLSRYGLKELEGGSGADERYTEFDPRVGITYRVNDSLSVYGGYATGSRIVPFFTGVNSAAPVPEESESTEVGLKIAGNQWSGTVAVFRLDREKIPQTDLTDPNFGSVQTGRQRSEGVEVDLVWEPIPRLSLLASAAYINSENRTDIVSFGTTFAAGNQLSRVPETSGRIAVRYRFLDGVLAGLGLGLGLTFADGAPLTDANEFFSDSYSVVDLQADYSIGPWLFRFNVVNLFDEDYLMPYQYLLQPVARPGQERSAFFSVGLSF